MSAPPVTATAAQWPLMPRHDHRITSGGFCTFGIRGEGLLPLSSTGSNWHTAAAGLKMLIVR